MSPVSYHTYDTYCYQFVSQPPQISDTIIDNALNFSIGQTNRYISLDIEAVAEAGLNTPKILNDIWFVTITFSSRLPFTSRRPSVYLKTLRLCIYPNFHRSNFKII